MNNVNPNKVGLVIGGMLAIWHAVWAVMVLVEIAKPFMDWILSLHFLAFEYSIQTFSIGKALGLVVVTGVIGYLIGYVIGWLWNLAHRASHDR